jgi:four helix bundle protein
MAKQVIDIRLRAMQYAVRAIKLYRHLNRLKDDVAGIIGKQYLRSATSIGANLVEGLSGESRRDFVNKYSIAQKEARESLYWLNLLVLGEVVPQKRVDDLIDETNQLIAILTTIIVKSKATIAK